MYFNVLHYQIRSLKVKGQVDKSKVKGQSENSIHNNLLLTQVQIAKCKINLKWRFKNISESKLK